MTRSARRDATVDHRPDRPSLAPRPLPVAAMWALAAAVSTPASLLVDPAPDLSAGAMARGFLHMLAHFAPWAASTPLFVRLSRAFPIGVGHAGRSLALFAAGAVVLTPLLTTAGTLASRTVGLLSGAAADAAFSDLAPAIAATTLFALPTYLAMVGIGQTVAYLERYRERERLLAGAQLQALRAQIAPHFLFNALNAVSALGFREPEKADRALVRLADLLRETLDRPAQIALRDEIAMIADYLDLHRLLLDDRMSFQLDAAPEVLDARIPTMLLQPLVENAVVHGLSRLPDGGTLSLKAAHAGRTLEITVANDAPVGADLSRAGLGLENVRRRLAAAYGDAGVLDLVRAGGAVQATVRLPLEAAAP